MHRLSPRSILSDHLRDDFYLIPYFLVFTHLVFHSLDGMHDGRMISLAEFLADRCKRDIEHVPTEVNRYLAGIDDIARPFDADEIRMAHFVVLLYDVLDRCNIGLLRRT